MIFKSNQNELNYKFKKDEEINFKNNTKTKHLQLQ